MMKCSLRVRPSDRTGLLNVQPATGICQPAKVPPGETYDTHHAEQGRELRVPSVNNIC